MRIQKLALTISISVIVLFCSINSLGQNDGTRFFISADRPAKVFIDKKEVGTLAEKEYKAFPVSPGSHYVEAVSIDGAWSTPELVFKVASGFQEVVKLTLTIPTDRRIGLLGSFVDTRDNLKYKTVSIDGKVWLAENLKFNYFRSRCYNDDENNCIKFGRLYFVDDALKVCPTDWHLPTKSEFENLVKLYPNTEIADLLVGGKSNLNLTFGGAPAIGKEGRQVLSFTPDKINTAGIHWADAPVFRRNDEFMGYVLYVNPTTVVVKDYYSRSADTGLVHMGSVRCVRN